MWSEREFQFFMENAGKLSGVSQGGIKEIIMTSEFHNFLTFQLQCKINRPDDFSTLYGIKISKETMGIPEAPKLFSRTELRRIKDALLVCATLSGDQVKAKHFKELFEKLTNYLESTTEN